MKRLLLILINICILQFGYAQTKLIDSDWLVIDDEQLNISSSIIINSQEIKWIQESVQEIITEFQITAIAGQWNDETNIGSLVFDIAKYGTNGTISLIGIEHSIKLEIDINSFNVILNVKQLKVN